MDIYETGKKSFVNILVMAKFKNQDGLRKKNG